MAKTNQELCDALATALDLEKKGRAFYLQAAKNCKAEPCREMFKTLAEHEEEHIENITRLYESLTAGQGFCELEYGKKGKPSVAKVFSELARKHGANISPAEDDLSALQTGINLEAEGLAFYQKQLEAAESPEEKQFFEAMVAEEKEHHQTLSDLRLYFSDPASWFQEKERSGLDGA